MIANLSDAMAEIGRMAQFIDQLESSLSAERDRVESLELEISKLRGVLKGRDVFKLDALLSRAEKESAEWKARAEQIENKWMDWGIIEIAVRNKSVNDYMHHWEGRARRAEKELDLRASQAETKMLRDTASCLTRENDVFRDRTEKAEGKIEECVREVSRIGRELGYSEAAKAEAMRVIKRVQDEAGLCGCTHDDCYHLAIEKILTPAAPLADELKAWDKLSDEALVKAEKEMAEGDHDCHDPNCQIKLGTVPPAGEGKEKNDAEA